MQRTRLLTFVPIALLAACSSQTGSPPSAGEPVVYEGAHLITGNGDAPIDNSAFVVENGKFTAAGKKGEVQAPANAARVDRMSRARLTSTSGGLKPEARIEADRRLAVRQLARVPLAAQQITRYRRARSRMPSVPDGPDTAPPPSPDTAARELT